MKFKKALLITLAVALLVPVSALSAFAMGEMKMGNPPADQGSTATVSVSADVTKAVDKLLATLSQVLEQAKVIGEKNPEEAAKLLAKALQIQEQASALLQKAAQSSGSGQAAQSGGMQMGSDPAAQSGGMQMGGDKPDAGMEPMDMDKMEPMDANEMAMEMAMEGKM